MRNIQERMTELEKLGVSFSAINPGWSRAFCSHWPTGPKGPVKIALTHANLDKIEAGLASASKDEVVLGGVFPKDIESHLDSISGDDEDLDLDMLDMLESVNSGLEYGEAPEAVRKPSWQSLTKEIRSHLSPDGLDSGLEKILLTALVMNPRMSSFDCPSSFKWEATHYPVVFQILHKLMVRFDLNLPYIEGEDGKPLSYFDRSNGEMVNRTNFPLTLLSHIMLYGNTGAGKTESYNVASRFIPAADALLDNFQSSAAFQRGIGQGFRVSFSRPSVRLTNNELLEPLNPGAEETEKKFSKVLALGQHPSLIGRKTKDPNKGYPLRLAMGGYCNLGDVNRSGDFIKNTSVQNALKGAGDPAKWGWHPVAGTCYPLGGSSFRWEIALSQLNLIASIGLYEIFRRTLALPVNPKFQSKPEWKGASIKNIDFSGASDWFDEYCRTKILVVPTRGKGKYPLECHRAQFTRIKGLNRYPLAEKINKLEEEGFLASALSDLEWDSFFVGTEYEGTAKQALTQFFSSLVAFIVLEFPYLFSGLLSDEDIAQLFISPSEEDINDYRKEYSKGIIKSMFRCYYTEFAEMLRLVSREHNATTNGVAALKIWISQQVDWLTSHDIDNLSISSSGKNPVIRSSERIPGGLFSQVNSAGFSLYRMALDGTAAKGYRLRDGTQDSDRPPLVYNGSASTLSKEFPNAVAALGYVPDQETGCYVLGGDRTEAQP